MNKQKGVSLYLAIVIMVILLTIVLGAATILVSQIKMIKEMENSVIAFYAADTGIEKVLQVIFMSGGEPVTRYPASGETPVGDSDASYIVDVYCCRSTEQDCVWDNVENPCPLTPFQEESCGSSLYCIKSVGSYKETKRAIEVGI